MTQDSHSTLSATPEYLLTDACHEIGKLNFTGNVIPHHWYQVILKDNGKPDINAILILSDILYWYRPVEVRSEATGAVVGYRSKFKSDFLQRTSKSIAEQFGFSQRQVSDALGRLESSGFIKRHYRDLDMGEAGTLFNVQFIELIPEAIKKIQNPDTPRKILRHPSQNSTRGTTKIYEYTETSKETTKESNPYGCIGSDDPSRVSTQDDTEQIPENGLERPSASLQRREPKIARAKHVSTTESEHERLVGDLGSESKVQACYERLSEWKQDTPRSKWKKDDNRSIRRWVIDALKETAKPRSRPTPAQEANQFKFQPEGDSHGFKH